MAERYVYDCGFKPWRVIVKRHEKSLNILYFLSSHESKLFCSRPLFFPIHELSERLSRFPPKAWGDIAQINCII